MTFSLFSTIFVTIATVKAKLMPDFYASVIFLINKSEEIGKKQLSVVGSKGAKLAP